MKFFENVTTYHYNCYSFQILPIPVQTAPKMTAELPNPSKEMANQTKEEIIVVMIPVKKEKDHQRELKEKIVIEN